ncbi:S8 family peptidase [Croceibacterium soli]|uniref:S8 family peptidase n=1 Tax=Croceibacterium soli TaxID=1739690 RepID=UPI002E276A3A
MPTQFDTAEFRRSDGPLQHNAATAWNAGATGQGISIAIVDTGIDMDSPEFTGRISPASRDVYSDTSSRGVDSTDDHGTNVALVAAAARNNTGIVGIAWNATIMALRADTPGSCVSDSGANDTDDDCTFSDGAISRAVDHAIANGARIINLSLGGGAPDTVLRRSVQRAANAGAVIVVSAGNDGQAELDSFAAGIDAAGGTSVIVAGSVDENGVISSFSNRAGNQPNRFLAARGQAICCVYKDGRIYVDSEGFSYLFSGTSFSAPQIAGAAALLAQAFPRLTGAQIVDVLLRSAFDAGAPGTDPVYGRGILDIARAFQPIGTTSLAGGTTPMAAGDSSGSTSPAMGDAAQRASLQTIVLDEYQRAFGIDLAGTMGGARVSEPLHGSLAVQRRQLVAGNEKASLAFTIDAGGRLGEPSRVGQLTLSPEDAEGARVLAARVALQLSPTTQVGFAFAQSADGLVAQLQGQDRPAFMIAGGAVGDEGLYRSTDAAVAVRRRLGPWGLTLSADSGETLSASVMRRAAELRGERERGDVQTFGLGLDRRFGGVHAALGLNWMREDTTMLGARFHNAFGVSGADTLFLDAQAGWDLADNWRLGAAMRHGWTFARSGGAVAAGSRLASRAWALDLTRSAVFSPGDSLAFRVSQPLRVERGGLNLQLPVDYSYETLSPIYGIRSMSLAPQGRELTGEIAWRGPLFTGDASASLFYRKDPGHYAALPDDKGVALSWSREF